MKITLTPSLFLFLWPIMAIMIYVPSNYFPYERSSMVDMSVFLVIVVTCYSYLINTQIFNTNKKWFFNLKNKDLHLKLVVIFLCYIAIFVFLGLVNLGDTVFTSKKVLDNASFLRFPINMKIYNGVILGVLWPIAWARRLFWLHIMISALFSFLFAERLHLMEFMFSFLVGRMLLSNLRVKVSHLVISGFLLFGLIIFFEATRNFYVIYFVKGSGISLWDGLLNLTERMAAYYGDTQNKLALAIEFDNRNWIPLIYVAWFKIQLTKTKSWFSGESIGDFADIYGYSYENLTNLGGFTLFYTDFGLLSAFIMVMFGVLPMLCFKAAIKRNSLLMAVLCAIMFINQLELLRLVYAFNLRGWISFLGVLFLLIVITRTSVRT